MELTVMIVDDDPIASFLLARLIKHGKLSDRPAALQGVQETLDYFERNDAPQKVYLVFLDINMPSMSGWQLMDMVRQKPFSGRVYFFIVTSSVDRADREKVQSYQQVIGYQEKPVDGGVLKTIKQMEMFRGVDFG